MTFIRGKQGGDVVNQTSRPFVMTGARKKANAHLKSLSRQVVAVEVEMGEPTIDLQSL